MHIAYENAIGKDTARAMSGTQLCYLCSCQTSLLLPKPAVFPILK